MSETANLIEIVYVIKDPQIAYTEAIFFRTDQILKMAAKPDIFKHYRYIYSNFIMSETAQPIEMIFFC